MRKLVWNEQIKLHANAISAVSSAVVVIYLLAPFAAAFYGSARPAGLTDAALALGSAIAVSIWLLLQVAARSILRLMKE
jgi:hypothetical protein